MSNENRTTPEVIFSIQEKAIRAESLPQLAEGILPEVASLANVTEALLYLHPDEYFQSWGFPEGEIDKLNAIVPKHFDHLANQASIQKTALSSTDYWKPQAKLILHPLRENGSCVGAIGLLQKEDQLPIADDQWQGLMDCLGRIVGGLSERIQLKKQVGRLNNYVTVSSMLVQPLGLHDMLEAALYCCMETTSAQASSVLLLGENKAHFHFYQVEGPAKPVLDAATFPIGKGIAGAVLESQESEIINDVQNDSRFYKNFDSKSEFQTRNMIAIPLTAGKEKIGVLEVLNKAEGAYFTENERLSLMMIAEEIAFAIRNARIFEYVVDSYCLQRQGETTCRGCKRPLGSWTPCVRYRENLTVLNMKSPL
ncbi:MAG: GAF domain-containing protein [Anaerolineales bacterium]|nr:GAF domain-containing protein [Chloroflexota bacterium]MBL6979980.1 GAF domain-containing protein [Anaerolineales bacterium]